MKEIYLDNNATTPVAPEVREAMLPYLGERFGNPSSLHAKGREAAQAVRESRASIARHLSVSQDEVIFTSGATESINLGIRGAALSARRERGLKTGHIVTSLVEHEAVLETCAALGGEGFSTTYLKPDEYGRVTAEQVRGALRDDTVLVAIMHVNNELGTIYPIGEIGRTVKERNPDIIMFSDGVQAFGKMPIHLASIDLYAISAHKLHGPKGIGALFVRIRPGENAGDTKQVIRTPLLYGGGQEYALRSGTENVAGIAGFAKATEIAYKEREKHEAHMRVLREHFLGGIGGIENVRTNSPDDGLFTTLNVSFPGVQAEALTRSLGWRGIYASSGSACSSNLQAQSHVLDALPVPEDAKRSAIRFGFSRYNTVEEIEYAVRVLKEVVPTLRANGMQKR